MRSDTSSSLSDTIISNQNANDIEKDTSLVSSIEVFQQDQPTLFQKIKTTLKKFRNNNREYIVECIGTMVMILLICGISAEETLHISSQTSALMGSLGSGLAVLVAISISGHVSGAHLNPTVTLTLCLFSGFPASKVFKYMIAQFIGAFIGSAILYIMIEPAISHFDGGTRHILGELGTAGIFGTYPAPYVPIGNAVISEIVGTTLLLLIILTTGHPENTSFKQSQGVFVSLGVFSICLSLGYSSGFSINPVRDLGPRFFTAVAGWGFDVFTVHQYYFFVPLLAPFFGALLGGLIYTFFIL